MTDLIIFLVDLPLVCVTKFLTFFSLQEGTAAYKNQLQPAI